MDIHADTQALAGLSSKLHSGADELDSLVEPPPAPDAGECTEAIAGLMAMLTTSAAEVVEIMHGLGTAVTEGRDVYHDTDYGTIQDVSRLDAVLGDN